MIYKVFYQENMIETPLRENTKSLMIEASSVEDVRKKLTNRGFNIEFIELMRDAQIAYEKK
ncbi:DNA-dependent RNA polymerase subunit epsilon [Brochothrix campestris]|uniref:Uncharacterized protein n=1 Tax=Brochothrix campestris FSL F6-1037 TaxID=1265861 RepID=W7D5V3_9LIST|nr:RNA polymerase epsilon subunit [Brochothrix campestris]EUJ40668.1 hypothetical protein BCAMP_04732 [Brochothrix campestris FSL F6-1037]